MRIRYKSLRTKQLDRTLVAFEAARHVHRPQKGWVRAVREALGVSSTELARRLGSARQLPLQFEKAEAEDRITLRSLRAAANALDCDLVYALVPRAGSMQALLEERARAEARRNVLGVEHSMALEDQAVGDIEDAIEAETQRLLARHAAR
jgi:predicted DNA-binding mobile mystery protein A